jgi:spore coat protein JB
MRTQSHHHDDLCNNRDELLKQLTILDFMLVDLALFLNTHPHEREAVEEYNAVACEADRVRTAYERLFGPLCSYRSKNNAPEWIWMNNPWPWSVEGNFNLLEGEVS